MKVGIIQSSFLPWRGYFDFITDVDLFILYDDIQYTKRDWRTRNKIKTAQGVRWLSVPVKYRCHNQLICETELDGTQNWRKDHINLWRAHYGKAAYLDVALQLLGNMGQGEDRTISQLNIRLIRGICSFLDIRTPMMLSSELNVKGEKTDRLIKLLQTVGGKTYLSGPSADSYLEKDKFREAGIGLEYKSYDYAPYPQLWGQFEGAVTVLDLIANCGPDAKNHIRSRTPDLVVVP